MGSNLDKIPVPEDICPLCHRECRNRIILPCKHCFCQGCIGELWSGSVSGPYFCPECNHEYGTSDFGDTDGASTSAGVRTNWTLGKRLSQRYSPKNVLGKRKFSSATLIQNSAAHRQGTITNNNSSDDNTPAKKKRPAENPSSGGCVMSSACEMSSNGTPPRKNAASTTEPYLDNHTESEQLGKASCSRIDLPKPGPAMPVRTHTKESSQKAPNSSNSAEQWSRTVPTTSCKLPEFGETSDAFKKDSSSCSSILCHYCPASNQRSAVKTCLVCCASMCSEHLRIHLDSPVFQSHPLVPAMEDVSSWKCQEHQEMNRIYCRTCGVCVCTVCTVIGSHKDHVCISIKEAENELRTTLKGEMKKIQLKEASVMNRISQLKEKQEGVQELLQGTKTTVKEQYQAMREALEVEEKQALLCIAQEESRVLGSVTAQIHLLKKALRTIQTAFSSLQGLGDAQGASRAKDQVFIMEYRKVAECVTELPDTTENMESEEEVNQGRLDSLQDWTERRLDIVIISMPHRDPLKLLYGLCPPLDPDTAHPKLLLSEDNRRVEYSESQQAYPDHQARFSVFPQVLASKALCKGRHYWEVEVTLDEGRWKVGVCDKDIGRKGQKDNCRIGFYPDSWCLVCEKGKVEALHDKVASPVCSTGLQKVGVLLDFEEGCLTFYSVPEDGNLTLLYSFKHTFSKPLYPALAVSKTQLSVIDLFARPTTD